MRAGAGDAATWLRFRTELRGHWRGTLALVLLLGLVGSVVLAAAAGARRTSTAPDRLVAAVGGEGDAHIFDVGMADPDRIRALPQVEHSVGIGFMLADSVPLSGLELAVTDDPLFDGLVAEGRLPDPADPLGAVIDQKVARRLGLGVGDELDIVLVTSEQLAAMDPATKPVPSATLRVAAVAREPDDIVGGDPAGDEAGGSDATVYLPESFLERFGHLTEVVNTVYYFELAGGAAATDEFVAAVRDLPAGDTVQFFDPPGVTRATQRSVDAQALGLGLFAAALALLGLLTAGQSLSRQLRVDASDGEVLRALGMTDRQRVAVVSLRGALVGVGAAVLAAAGAVAWSPLTPVGVARQAEPHPGAEVNVAVLGGGRGGDRRDPHRPRRADRVADRKAHGRAPVPGGGGLRARRAGRPGRGGTTARHWVVARPRLAGIGGLVSLDAGGRGHRRGSPCRRRHLPRQPRSPRRRPWTLRVDLRRGGRPDL